MKFILRWLRSHRKLSLLLLLVFFFIVLNILAYRHAYAMTHFVAAGSPIDKPEAMSFLKKVGVLFSGVRIPRPAGMATPAKVGLAYETHSIHVDDGTRLEAWYIARAEAKGVVLLFHGYASCKANLLAEAKAFHGMGYAVLMVDFRGSGGSSGNVTTIGVYEADDVKAACDFVAAKEPGLPVILYGQSMGSVAILRACAVRDVKARALVLECPFDRLLTTVGNRFASMGLPSFPGAHLLVFWGGAQHGFNGFSHNPADYARSISCPTLLLHGANDPRVTADDIRAVDRCLAADHRLELLDGVGHESYVTARPEEWRRIVGEFLLQRVGDS
jgi:alpha-beta hydrolase superfamily lysophospholipase